MLIVLAAMLLQSTQQGEPAMGWEVLRPNGTWVLVRQDEQGALRGLDGVDELENGIVVRRLGTDAVAPVFRYSAVHLSDGQVLSGGFAAFVASDGNERLRWKHPGLGLVDIPIDQVAGIEFDPTRPAGPPLSTDRVLLHNGDAIEGLVVRFGDPLGVEVNGTTTEVPLGMVSSLWLVAPTVQRSGQRVWLADGTVLDGTLIEGAPSGSFLMAGAKLAPGNATLPLRAEEVLAIERRPNRALPLSSLTVRVEPTSTGLPRASLPTPIVSELQAALSASTTTIRGPERLLYKVPQGYSVFSAEIETLPSLREWVDCAVIVKQAGREIARVDLSKANPAGRIHASVNPGTFELEVTQGRNGPIGDTVLIRRGLLIATDDES